MDSYQMGVLVNSGENNRHCCVSVNVLGSASVRGLWKHSF